MNKDIIKDDFNFWRYLINFWSIFFFVVIVLDFFAQNAYESALNVLSVVYVSALAIYVSNKEFERWYDVHHSKHPGEFFVIAWSFLVFCLFILSFIYEGAYKIPNSVVSSYIAVLTVLAVTRKSREMYIAKNFSSPKQETKLTKKKK